MAAIPAIVFVCPHGAAKSVIAAAYCQRLAQERGVPVQVTAVGTEPDSIVSPLVVATLDREGIDVSGHQPRLVTREDTAGAWRIVTLGCELAGLAPVGQVVERWDDVPATSQDLPAALAAIARHVTRLVDDLAREGVP